MTTHIMLDLETMGNGPTAAIAAIGAVAFDKDGIQREFYKRVDLQSCIDLGLTVDASTVMWWMRQSEEARLELSNRPRITIGEMEIAFSAWVREIYPDSFLVWGNGAAFDNAIMINAFRRISPMSVWPHWCDRCYRTIRAQYPDIIKPEPEILHHALHDAKSQALHLMEIAKRTSFILEE